MVLIFQNYCFGDCTYMFFQVLHTVVNVRNYFHKLRAGRRECRIVQSLNQMVDLRKVLKSGLDIVTNVTQLSLLADQILTGFVE